MLRCNTKVWAVVVIICIIAQFVTATLPGITETFNKMDVEFEQRAEEEKAKIPEPTIKPTVEPTVESTVGDGASENDTINADQTSNEAIEESENKLEDGPPSIIIILGLVLLAVFVLLATL